jgi:hypothetical protein
MTAFTAPGIRRRGLPRLDQGLQGRLHNGLSHDPRCFFHVVQGDVMGCWQFIQPLSDGLLGLFDQFLLKFCALGWPFASLSTSGCFSRYHFALK